MAATTAEQPFAAEIESCFPFLDEEFKSHEGEAEAVKILKEASLVVRLLRYPSYQSHVVVSCNHTSAITYNTREFNCR